MSTHKSYDPEQNRNMIIALVIAGLIMFAFEIFYNAPIREQQQQARQQAALLQAEKDFSQSKQELLDGISEKEFVIEAPRTEEEFAKVDEQRIGTLSKAPRVKIDNGVLHGSINLQGVRFDDITLANYHRSIEEGSPEIVLAAPSGTYNATFIETGFLGSSNTPDSKTVWTLAQGDVLTASRPVTFEWDNGQGITFRKTVSLDDKYMFSIEDSIVNNSGSAVELSPFGLISKKKLPIVDTGALGVPEHNGALTIVEEAVEEITFDDIIEDRALVEANATEWLGLTDKYWLQAIIPADKSFEANFRHSERSDKFQIDYLGKNFVLSAGETKNFNNKIFIGAKKLETLEEYVEKYDIHLFDRAVNFGWLYLLCAPLYALLIFFQGWVGNWGVAIIMVTICVKALLFPLSRKAYVSMGKMKLISPKLKEIQEKHKDDRSKLSQEMMALYKREGVNPAAGCLPILLQIPFFIALYRLIYTAIEMRHAPFYGWIQDLSAPDPTSFWNFFGMLPYDAPTFLAIGIWPIIMCITMFLQQALNPAPADPMQAKFLKALPLLFLFLFYSFPAGLIIYWSFSNIITFLQQLYFTRRLQQLKPNEISKFE